MELTELIETLRSLSGVTVRSKPPEGDPRMRTVFSTLQRLLVDFPRHHSTPRAAADLQPLIDLFGEPSFSPEQRISAMFHAAVAAAVPDQKDYWTQLLTTDQPLYRRLGLESDSRSQRDSCVYGLATLLLRATEHLSGASATAPADLSTEIATEIAEEGQRRAVDLGEAVPAASSLTAHNSSSWHRRWWLVATGFLVLVMVVSLATTGTWPFDRGPTSFNQVPSPAVAIPATVGCSRPTLTNEPFGAPQAGGNAVLVKLQAQPPSATSWSAVVSPVQPGAIVRYLLTYQNQSNAVQDQVVLRANLPPGTQLVPNSTCLYDASHPDGKAIDSNDVDLGGIDVGDFGVHANAFLLFSIAMPPLNDLLCGVTKTQTVGVAHPLALNEYYNTSDVSVRKSCSTAGTSTETDSISALVRLPGQNPSSWVKSEQFPAGDPVEWGIDFVHESASEYANTTIFDEVPTGVVVVPGSVRLYNGSYPNGYAFPATAVQANGSQININIGDYLPLSTNQAADGLLSAQIVFDTEFVSVSPSNCVRRVITNRAWVGTAQYPRTLSDSAMAEVSC